MRCLYFGCWNTPGHYLVGPGGDRSGLPNDEAWDLSGALDGGFGPRKGRSGKLCWRQQAPTSEQDRVLNWELRDSGEYPQGQFLRHRFGKWSLIQWWDRCQGDKRGACNSTILLEGEHTSEELLTALKEHFPHVLTNLEKAGVELVEVLPGQT
jgi:hypothetical protein